MPLALTGQRIQEFNFSNVKQLKDSVDLPEVTESMHHVKGKGKGDNILLAVIYLETRELYVLYCTESLLWLAKYLLFFSFVKGANARPTKVYSCCLQCVTLILSPLSLFFSHQPRVRVCLLQFKHH